MEENYIHLCTQIEKSHRLSPIKLMYRLPACFQVLGSPGRAKLVERNLYPPYLKMVRPKVSQNGWVQSFGQSEASIPCECFEARLQNIVACVRGGNVTLYQISNISPNFIPIWIYIMDHKYLPCRRKAL